MAKSVAYIPSRLKEIKDKKMHRQLRVAAYCRVSTDQEEQQSSYQAQIDYYTDKIAQNPEWSLAGIFADEGISGIHAKNRTEFMRMISLCKKGEIDLVLTKSISRFSRNTIECIGYIRLLQEKGIPIVFEKEGINTMEVASEMTISLLGSFAQAESESLSKNVTWGKRQGFKNGNVSINYTNFLGYEKGPDGKPQIVPEQAHVVKMIYKWFLEGQSVEGVKKLLETNNHLSPGGNEKWTVTTIRSILSNEKYVGDALLQKTYVSNFITKKVRKNNGELPQYYVTDHHEGIIEKDVFYKVQEELTRRSGKRKVADKCVKTEHGKYSSKYALTELLICGTCGTQYRRVIWTKKGKKKALWRCINRLEYGTKYCTDSPSLEEPALHQAILNGINRLAENKDDLISTIKESLSIAIQGSDEKSNTFMIENKIQELNDTMLALVQVVSKSDGDEDRFDDQFKSISGEIKRLQLILNAQKEQETAENKSNSRLKDLFHILESESLTLNTFDDILVRQIVDTIKVRSKDKILIIFNGGFELEERMEVK
jgi:site-specific DNA recombinase